MFVKRIRQIILSPFSLMYLFVISIRNALYDFGFLKCGKLPGYCISIGNIEVGGTGKTPTVLALAQHLRACSARVAILTRGYRSGLNSDDMVVMRGEDVLIGPVDHTADEGRMLSCLLKDVPVIIGAKRLANARAFMERLGYSPTHWILDDGFQHRKIVRDLDVVLVPRLPHTGALDLLPGGKFRETLGSLRRAHVVLWSNDILAGQVSFEIKEKRADSNEFIAACAIANPERFFMSCKVLKVSIFCSIVLGDHVCFSKKQFEGYDPKFGVVTTEKDYYRHPSFWQSLNRTVAVIRYRIPYELTKDPPYFVVSE